MIFSLFRYILCLTLYVIRVLEVENRFSAMYISWIDAEDSRSSELSFKINLIKS